MRIKLDENMPAGLKLKLERLGHDVDTSPAEGLAGRADAEVGQAAQAAGRFFVTQDLDFSDVRQFMPGSHAGLLLVRLGDMPGEKIVQHVSRVLATEDVNSW